jgi:hypothetical protein
MMYLQTISSEHRAGNLGRISCEFLSDDPYKDGQALIRLQGTGFSGDAIAAVLGLQGVPRDQRIRLLQESLAEEVLA